jgi:hypothetical protein
VVLMAPAPPRPGTEQEFYSQARGISAPVLLLVAENDLPQYNNEQQDHVALAVLKLLKDPKTSLHQALSKRRRLRQLKKTIVKQIVVILS